MRIACSFEPAILIYFYRGVISQPLFASTMGKYILTYSVYFDKIDR